MAGANAAVAQFLPTPSVRRATDATYIVHHDIGISTHALREEGDLIAGDGCPAVDISTHALREEGDIDGRIGFALIIAFLPTPSVRRATRAEYPDFLDILISTHALREEGDRWPARHLASADISTHALREEGDHHQGDGGHRQTHFYPRPP